ncbi:putative Oligosaccharide biosynthesis protein Alg14 like-domain-containing protein [Seiridium unicorne]|uniref:UDP-N-acetylglucosamine transferase subunit ALG14 n=1 Tax=Seiridium unicorne TaxID=138068 RepID=A0ABR2UJP3_9PEZI
MASNSGASANSSLAEGTASAVQNTVAPRLRRALKNTNNSVDSTTSASSQSSNSSSQPLNEFDNDNNNADMGPTEIATAMDRLVPATISEDYFGPLYYTTGEVLIPVFWFILSALIFFLLGIFYMVLASLCAIAFVQSVKLAVDKGALEMMFLEPFRMAVFRRICRTLYVIQLLMTGLMGISVLVFGPLDRLTSWVSVLFASLFVGIQFIYWPLHGYRTQILHKSITTRRPQNRHKIVESIDGAIREHFTYNIGAFLIIFAGSGGHTTEVLSILELSEHFDNSMFRRYVVTKGDQRSYDMINQYEQKRREKRHGKVTGAHDIVWVSRARYVGQSWLTTPFTALSCLYDCFGILTMGRPLATPGQPEAFPQTLLCNGPGSSAIFVLVSHLMRMYGVIPANRCTTVFVESVARVKSLSMTGKIFYWLDLADAFITQHDEVGLTYPEVVCEKMLVKRAYTSWDVRVVFEDTANIIVDDY